jgi:hypothetical protein
MIRLTKNVGILCLVALIMVASIVTTSAWPVIAGSVDVSGYTNKGVYVYGDLDINSDGSVDGYVYTPKGRSIYVEGEIVRGGSVEIDSDDWGGGGYELDVD